MILIEAFIHFSSIGICIVLSALGVAIGQSKTAQASFDAINRQPAAKEAISRSTILSLALIETSGLFGFIGAVLLSIVKTNNIYDALAQLGFAFAIGIPGLLLGIVSAKPASSAIFSIARQPFIATKIRNFLIIILSLVQTPLAFGIVIALLIRTQINYISNLPHALGLMAAGLCVGFGCVGPILGAGFFTQKACQSIGLNDSAIDRMLTFTIISQAIIETPAIFAIIISFLLLRLDYSNIAHDSFSIVYFAIAFVMGFGTLGPGISSGKTAAPASQEIALSQQNAPMISITSIIAQGILDTSAIFAFFIALVIIWSIS